MSIYVDMLYTALRRSQKNGGSGQSDRGHYSVSVHGEREVLWTFVGVSESLHGSIWVRHYGSNVFAIDFEKKRITDFGMYGRSQTTSNCISGFRRAIYTRFVRNENEIHGYSYGAWTDGPQSNTTVGDSQARFIKRIPWVKKEGGVGWFLWDKYIPTLSAQYWDSEQWLRDDQNWRYFMYDWDQDGNWSRRFKDENAERLHAARSRRRAKKWKAA